MTFLDSSAPSPGTRIVLAGLPGADEIRRASQAITAWSPRLGRDFRDLEAGDAGVLPRDLHHDLRVGLMGGRPGDLAPFLASRGVPVLLSLSGRLQDHGHAGACWLLGGRSFERDEVAEARRRHRVLPFPEVDLRTAVRTARLEVGARSCHVALDLDVLDPAFAPGVASPLPVGAAPADLLVALRDLGGLFVTSFSVCGLVPGRDATGRTALLAAELVRDLALILWGG